MKSSRIKLLTVFILLSLHSAKPCSMYKITVKNKTLLGSNYDAYYLTSRIWFENAPTLGTFGAVFTGGRFDENNEPVPQSGMNEVGLAYTQAAVPLKESQRTKGKKAIDNPTHYLKEILHTCKTIEEVKDYIDQYDHSYFPAVFLYTDKSGKYLIVEPDTLLTGRDEKYVLSNFCPSTTKNLDEVKMKRYRNGVQFLKNKVDTSLAFCTALSDTMHVCRKKIGDGTLLTSIWDLNKGITYLYFYHDYKHLVQFSLLEELAKGDHFFEIPPLFPSNIEYEKLSNFKTPNNSPGVQLFLIFCCILFSFSSLFFIIHFLKTRNTESEVKKNYNGAKILLLIMNILSVYYIIDFSRDINAVYFPAPYNTAGYIPLLLLTAYFPLLLFNLKVLKNTVWEKFPKYLFTLNNLAFVVLLGLFAYWELYCVF